MQRVLPTIMLTYKLWQLWVRSTAEYDLPFCWQRVIIKRAFGHRTLSRRIGLRAVEKTRKQPIRKARITKACWIIALDANWKGVIVYLNPCIQPWHEKRSLWRIKWVHMFPSRLSLSKPLQEGNSSLFRTRFGHLAHFKALQWAAQSHWFHHIFQTEGEADRCWAPETLSATKLMWCGKHRVWILREEVRNPSTHALSISAKGLIQTALSLKRLEASRWQYSGGSKPQSNWPSCYIWKNP